MVDFGEINKASSPQKMVVQTKRGNASIKWNALQLIDGGSNLQMSAEQRPDSDWNFIFRLDASDLPIATFRRVVKVQLIDNGKVLAGNYPITVVAKVTGLLKSDPSTLYCGVVSPSSNISRVIILSSSGAGMERLVVSCDSPEIKSRISRSASGQAILDVHMTAPSQTGVFSHKLYVTSDALNSKVVVNIFGIVQ